MRQTGTKTRFPGVYSLGDRRYRLTAKAINPKNGRAKQLEQIHEAASALDASRLRAEMIRASAKDEATPQERQRLATFSLSWLKRKKAELKASTFDRYTRTFAHHITPILGEHYIDAITHADIVAWRDAQTGEPSSINGRLRVLKTLLADATIELDLTRDPSARVPALRERRQLDDEDSNCLTADQLRALLEAMRKTAPRWYALLAVLAFTGMRIGEATALQWGDIDEAAATIRVRRSIDRGHVDTTKTGTKRTAPLLPMLAAILGDHRRTLDYEGLDTEGTAWLFPSRVAAHRGKPMHKKALRKPLLRALASAELHDRLTPHGLRRTFNDLMRQVASGEVVRSIMGHATERMTEHYSHVRMAEKASAAARVLHLVHPSSTRTVDTGMDETTERKTAG